MKSRFQIVFISTGVHQMKKLGLLGGTSWHSSMDYYRLLNKKVQQRLGGVHSADLILRSVNFEPFHQFQVNQQWDLIAEYFAKDALHMQSMGAEGIVICANTMHRVADSVASQVDIPVLHIADAIAKLAQKKQWRSLGVLGTIFTMEQEFYRSALEQRELKMITPESEARQHINRVIFKELVKGQVLENSRRLYLTEIVKLSEQGADAVILGCTEIGMLVEQSMTQVPLIDSLQCHVDYLTEWMLTN